MRRSARDSDLRYKAPGYKPKFHCLSSTPISPARLLDFVGLEVVDFRPPLFTCMAGAVMSHCPASGIAPCPDGVKNPSDASARGRTRSLSCSPSNLRGRQGGQPACRSHSASWSMTPRAHCSQQQAVAARPTTRSSSLFVSTFNYKRRTSAIYSGTAPRASHLGASD